MDTKSPYTFNTTAQGNVEVFQNGGRISTGTASAAKSYGYVSPAEQAIVDNQKAASNLSASMGTSSPSSTPYVSNSSSVVTGEQNTMSSLQSLMGQTGDVKSLIDNFNNSMSDMNAYSAALEARRAGQVDTINKQYESAKADTTAAQDKETGSTNVALTRLGGYLGGSGSQVGVLNNLAVTHRTELAKLDSQRDAAISAANTAIEDKQFGLAQIKADEVKALTQTIYQRNQDFFANALKLQGEARAQMGEQRDQNAEQRAQEDQQTQNIQNLLKGIGDVASSGIDVAVDPQKAQMIDSYYGVPGFTAAYADAQNKAAQIKSAKDAQEAQKASIDTFQSYVNLLESVPAGTKIPFGDEVVTGIGKTSDLSTFQIEDKYGNVRIVNYNKGNGQYSISNMGAIGKPSATSTSIPDEVKSDILSKATVFLETAQDEKGNPLKTADGKYSASAYLNMIEQANKVTPGAAQYLNGIFLNPSFDYGARYFDDADLTYLRQKAGIGAQYGAIPSSQ